MSRSCWLLMLALWLPAALAESGDRLVFGSFRSEENAGNWAARLSSLFDHPVQVEQVHGDDGIWFRVRSRALTGPEAARLERVAEANRIPYWYARGTLDQVDTVTSSIAGAAAEAAEGNAATDRPAVTTDAPAGQPRTRAAPYGAIREESAATAAPARAGPDAPYRPASRAGVTRTDIDLGLQTRSYFDHGLAGQSRFQPSVSARLDYYRAWDDERQSLTISPFVRVDAQDSERTHFDLRELFWSRVGNDWDLHLGFKQVFWGVTEFQHLVDIINQTDLVENIDGEDKLGQPMAHLSLIRDWGIVDLFVLTGFRERTFPGEDGRLRPLVPVDVDHPIYESGAGSARVDGALRWSHHWGPLNFGVYHFSGTSRDPAFVPHVAGGDGRDTEVTLRPLYRVIDQTGFDGQAIVGDWAFKLETITRSGDGDRYLAFTGGFERTLVGVLGSRSDLGVIMEYMYDERGDEAYNTLFERDLAVGARWSLNDMADTQALLGVILDLDTEEYVLSLEASRRLGLSWSLLLEGRVFGGVRAADMDAALGYLLEGPYKSAALQQDDYVQLELTRYF